jgi:chromosome partitioning protein
MIITLCNGKGGVGKTTLTMLLASALLEAGHPVSIEDLDPQQTATRWVQSVGSGLVINKDPQANDLLIDTPGRLDSPDLLRAINRSDVIIVVSSPSPADLFTTSDTSALIRSLGRIEQTRLLFNGVHPRTILARDLTEMASRVGLEPLQNKIQHRQSYQHAALVGWKALTSEAREELLRLAVEITGFYGSTVRPLRAQVA